MAEKALIFPFGAKDFSFVSNLSDLNCELEIIAVCSNEGSGLIGHDIAFSVNWKPRGILVQKYKKELLYSCDVVIILSHQNVCIKKDSIKLIHEAIELNKNIICCMKLTKQEITTINRWINENSYKARIDFLLERLETEYKSIPYVIKHYIPHAPVIFIGGLLEKANQEEVLLALAIEFRKKGYIVSGLGYSKCLDLIGLKSYYYALQEGSPVSMIEKINSMIANMERVEVPDLILVQLPGALMKFDNIIKEDFGVYSYIFTQAVSPDFLVCCTMCNALDDQFLRTIAMEIERKMSVTGFSYHLTNVILNNSKSLEFKKPYYYCLSPEEMEANRSKVVGPLSMPIYNIQNNDECEALARSILTELSSG